VDTASFVQPFSDSVTIVRHSVWFSGVDLSCQGLDLGQPYSDRLTSTRHSVWFPTSGAVSSGAMRRRPRASPVVTTATPARDARPDGHCAGGRYSSGRPGTFAGKFRPRRAAAAANAR